MTRISEQQINRTLLNFIGNNRTSVQKLSEDISSGIRVSTPGDSPDASTIEQFRSNLEKVESYQNRLAGVTSSLEFQNEVLNQANDILIRAKEIASQAASETNSPTTRSQLASEVLELRDHLASLGNSKYLGRYIYGLADDDDPPFDDATYTNPSTGLASKRYVFDAEAGTSTRRTINLTDNLSITVDTPGDQIFSNGIEALERLGRSLSGYKTLPVSGTPDGTGDAYTFPGEFHQQTLDIQGSIDLLDSARKNDILVEQNDIAGRQERIETAKSLLELTKSSSQTALSTLQDTDVAEAASALVLARTALEASYAVSAKVGQISILDYL